MKSVSIQQKELLNNFTKVTGELIQVLSEFSQLQLNSVPFDGSWTPGQVGDHLSKVYNVSETLTGKVTDTSRDPELNNAGISSTFLNFEIKMESPEFVLPTAETIHKQELIASLEEKITRIANVIQTHDLTKTCLDFELPMVGTLTRSEWINFVIVHTKRHLHQLNNIKSYFIEQS